MRRDFEGGVYWGEMADRCGDISRAAGFRGAARFRGNTVILMVHVVKVVNTHIDARASIAEMESKINFRLRVSMLQSKEMNSTAQYNFRTSDRSWHDACYK